jgi:hypothetical protein
MAKSLIRRIANNDDTLRSRRSLLAIRSSEHRIRTRHYADRSPVGGIEEHDAAEAGIAADPYHSRIGDDVATDRAQKMR